MQKHYITANSLLEDSFTLAQQVYNSGFLPDFIMGVWRGGTPTGIAVQEYLEYKGLDTDHIAVRTSSYTGIDQQKKTVDVFGFEYVVQNLAAHHKLLIVDDVFDTGRSIRAILDAIKANFGADYPAAVKVACPWFKPSRNLTDINPDYFLHETDQWLVFPHELCGLSHDEIREGKGDPIADTL